MTLAIVVASVTVVGSVATMLVPFGGRAPSRHRVLGAFGTMNLGAAAFVAATMGRDWISNAMLWLFVVVAVMFFVAEIRAWQIERRELSQAK